MILDERPLAGRQILVVEDDFHIARTLVRLLTALGAKIVGPAPGVDAALRLIRSEERIDSAVLDINLGQEMVYEVADILLQAAVHTIFTSGYDTDTIPARYSTIPCLQKPYAPEQLIGALLDLDTSAGLSGTSPGEVLVAD